MHFAAWKNWRASDHKVIAQVALWEATCLQTIRVRLSAVTPGQIGLKIV